MANSVLVVRVHLGEGLLAAGRDEHRIIAEAPVASGWPDDGTIDTTDKRLSMAVGPGDAQSGDEPGAVVGIVVDPFMHARHRGGEILRRPCPPCGVNAGRTEQRGNANPELSDSVGIPLAVAPATALIWALPVKSGASSTGSGRPSAAAE